MTSDSVPVRLVGEVAAKIWGLPVAEWQQRSWTKAGAQGVDNTQGRLLVGTEWILSPSLQRNLLARPGGALLVAADGGERLAAVHLPGGAEADAFLPMLCGQQADRASLEAEGLTPGDMHFFADAYNQALRKRETPYALSVCTDRITTIERTLFKGAYKGVTDLVTKYAWPEPAFHATRLCAFLRISPNTVTTASLVLVLIAFWLFWQGQWGPGLVAAWLMTFLDTVDGKLARTTMTYSKWGNIYDHGIDLIHPPFWYWAIFMGLEGTGAGPSSDLLVTSLGVITVFYVLNRLEELAFMRRFGFHIHVWRPIDSRMREITARRNPNMLIFMLAVLAGQPGWGFVLVAVWTALCLLFHGVRLAQAFMQETAPVSWLER